MTGDVLQLTNEWDKTFPKSEKVNHRKVTFANRYGITLAADLYEPKDAKGKLPAVAVSGPFGAVKEQSSGLYAQTMAERGFLTSAFDRPTPERAAAHQDIWLPLTSIQRILWRQSIFCLYRNIPIRKKSELSESAVGEVWR